MANLVARPFDELSKAHRVLQWLELGSLRVCWLTLHAGTGFFIEEKVDLRRLQSLAAENLHFLKVESCLKVGILQYVFIAFFFQKGGQSPYPHDKTSYSAYEAHRPNTAQV